MAADSYVSSAIRQVKDAILALQTDISILQRSTYDYEQQIRREVDSAQTHADVVRVQRDERLAHNDRSEASSLGTELQRTRQTMDQKKQSADQRSTDAAAQVQRKQDAMRRLQNVAAQLEALIASVR